MTLQEQALVRLARSLSDDTVPYMVIGGVANAVWGEPRVTLDIDVTVGLPLSDVDRLVDCLAPHFAPLVEKPMEFVADTRVLPMRDEAGVRVDLIFGLLPFERQAIQRAKPVDIGGTTVQVCTAEDLILLKIVSTRERDLADVRGLVERNLRDLDLAYLEPRIRELADLLDRPEMVENWRIWKREASRGQ